MSQQIVGHQENDK